MTARRRVTGRLVADGSDGVESLLRNMGRALEDLEPGESLHEFAARQEEVIQDRAAKIEHIARPYDAFDIIELLRQREMPITLAGFFESQHDGLAAVIEIVSLILLSGRLQRAGNNEREPVAPSSVIGQLHEYAMTILRVGSYGLLLAGQKQNYGPLTGLSSEYRSSKLSIRYNQYASIHDRINEELFGKGDPRNLIREALGFSYEELISTREAIGKVYLDKLMTRLDALVLATSEYQAEEPDSMSAEQKQSAGAMMDEIFGHPGERASFTVEEVSKASGQTKEATDEVLNLFSVTFDTSNPASKVQELIEGRNPFFRTNLIRDENGKFISLHLPIGTDSLRLIMEERLKGSSQWAKYDKHRTNVSEKLSVEYLEQAIGVPAYRTSFKYFAPKTGINAAQLGPEAASITSIANEVEADALFLVEDVAICVEVKGRSISDGAKWGNIQRLTGDLEKTAGEATSQARRLEDLITQNRGLWLADRTWLDLGAVHEVRSIAVCLDDFGPLAIALDELVRGGILKADKFPWIVSLHDLAVIAKVTDRAAEFLLYLRRRTESGVSRNFRAVDELDLYMLFVKGGLYVDPDPEKVYLDHPKSGKPTTAALRRFKKSNVPTRVHTHTDELDAWMYAQEGSSDLPAEKPSFRPNQYVAKIADFLEEGKKPGWFRFSSDLLNLSSDAQSRLARDLNGIISSTKSDHLFHSVIQCLAGSWGFPIFVACTCPNGMPRRIAKARMVSYMAAKKHQLQSDRALGVLIDESGDIIVVHYDNSPYEENPELDELVRQMGLVSPDVMGRPIPPSARRATRRLRANKSSGKKR